MWDVLGFPISLQLSSEANGYMILAPNAVDYLTNATRHSGNCIWNVYADYVNPVPPAYFVTIVDIGFLAKLAKWAIDERGADPNRVYLMGVSNGAAMVYRALWDTYPPIYAAAATFLAVLPELKRGIPPLNRSTPLFVMSGTKDGVTNWDGGIIGEKIGLNVGVAMSGLKTKETWVALNKADASKVQMTLLPNRNWFDGCRVQSEIFPAIDSANGAPVAFHTVNGGGHIIPSNGYSRSCWLWSCGFPGNYKESVGGPV